MAVAHRRSGRLLGQQQQVLTHRVPLLDACSGTPISDFDLLRSQRAQDCELFSVAFSFQVLDRSFTV